MSFEVADVVQEVRELEQRGVGFEDYDLPDLKTVDHVCVHGQRQGRLVQGPGRQRPLRARDGE